MSRKVLTGIVAVFIFVLVVFVAMFYIYFSKANKSPNIEGLSFRTLEGKISDLGLKVDKTPDQVEYMQLTGVLKNHYREKDRNYLVLTIPYKNESLDVAVDLGSDSNLITDITQEKTPGPGDGILGMTVTTESRNKSARDIVENYSNLMGKVMQVEIWTSQGYVDNEKCDNSDWCSYIRTEIERNKKQATELMESQVSGRSILNYFSSRNEDVVVGPVISVRASY